MQEEKIYKKPDIVLKAETKYYENESMFHGFIPHVMGTRFDCLLIHPDLDLLNEIWLGIINELWHLDKMLNRFDPNSEVAQLNAQAPQTPIQVSRELETILHLCQTYYEKTFHLFDITLKEFSQIKFHGSQQISFDTSELTLDFGGFAKGYALKKIKDILLQGGIQHAFVDFGNSSILGIGHHPYGDCWKVSFQNPYDQRTLSEFNLKDTTLSTSGNTLQYTRHIMNPLNGTYNEERKASTIVSTDPLDAEILSTVWMIANEEQRERITEHFNNIQGTIYTL